MPFGGRHWTGTGRSGLDLLIVASGWSFVVRSLFLFHGSESSRGLFTSPSGMVPMHVISEYHSEWTAHLEFICKPPTQFASPCLAIRSIVIPAALHANYRPTLPSKCVATRSIVLSPSLDLSAAVQKQGEHPDLSREQQQQQ